MPQKKSLKDGRVMVVDRATAEDAQEILEYFEQAAAESDNLSFGSGELQRTIEDQAKILERYRDCEFEISIKGVVGGKIVSYLNITRSTRGRLKHSGEFGISVLKEFWNAGVGAAMLECLIEWAQAVRLKRIELRVRTDNSHAIYLYKRFGFIEEGLKKSALFVGGKYFDELCMARIFDL